MTVSCLPPTRTSKRLADRLIVVSLFPFAFGLILLLFGTVRSFAADPCLDNLPAPTPLLHRVVQLVNCSNQRVLGAANAAHVAGLAPIPVLPRENTWVMEPFPVPAGAPANANVKSETTMSLSARRFDVRVGGRYDPVTSLPL